MKIIAIEEHWNSAGIRDALDRLQNGARDESVAFNTMGDSQARLEDIGPGRVEVMDAPSARIRPASARSRPCRPAIRRPRPQNSNGAPPSWVTSAR
jgi:hypothetical protein